MDNEYGNSGKKSKKDVILITVTVLLVIVWALGLVFDSNQRVFNRYIDFEQQDYMTITRMNKGGIMVFRNSFQAQVEIPTDEIGCALSLIMDTYDCIPEIYDANEFKAKYESYFVEGKLIPQPSEGTEVSFTQITTEKNQQITFVITQEGDKGYLYVFYLKPFFS